MRTIKGRKIGKQASSLFTGRKGKHHGRVFSTPTEGQQALIEKAKRQTLILS